MATGSVEIRGARNDATGLLDGAVKQDYVDGAASVRATSSDLIDPLVATLERSATIAAAGVLTTFTDVTPYNVCSIIVSAIETSITVDVSNDGITYSSVNVKDIGDGTFKAITGTGAYELSGKFKSIKLTAVGAGTATAQILLGVK